MNINHINHFSQISEYLELVNKYHAEYIQKNKPLPKENPGIRKEIYDSWIRSQNYKIDPFTTPNSQFTKEQYRQILQENKNLIEISGPYIKKVYDYIKGSNFIVHLVNAQGMLLSYMAGNFSPNILEIFENSTTFQEEYIRMERLYGTDSTSLCLILGAPTQVIGAEHYLTQNHHMFCSSAPIRDSDKNLLGVLTMVGPLDLFQNHTLGVIVATSNAIELALENKQYQNQLEVYNKELLSANSLLTSVINELPSAMVILNQKHKILNYNKKFIKIFRLFSDDFIGADFFSVLDRESFPEKLKALDEAANNVSFTAATHRGVSADVLLSVEINYDNSEPVITLIFDEQKYIHTLVNRFSSQNATYTFDSIVGNSAAIENLKALGETAARSTSNVLILGESGTGKELLAQSIHNASDRARGPFITINCGSMPKNLIESELFGYESGAFTGAKKDGHPGKFELANGGTLFLDEIGDMPIELQTSLLRVLQSHEVTRLGGKYPKYVDVKIIAATNVDLENAVRNKTFRLDLYYRLNVLSLNIPPLRERIDDIEPLVDTFILQYSAALKKQVTGISPEAFSILKSYFWPGNVRELENTIERAINIVKGREILPEDLPAYMLQPSLVPASPKSREMPAFDWTASSLQSREEFQEGGSSPEIRERREILRLIELEHGHVSTVAEKMNIPASTLYRKLHKYNINPKKYKGWS